MSSRLLDRVAVLRGELEALPHLHSVAFAALTTERLYPFFEEFSRCARNEDFRLFQHLLDSVWKYVLTGSRDRIDFSKLKEQCYGIELGNEDGDSKYPGCDIGRGALEAVGALYQTLELCESTDPDKAAAAAEIAMERVRREVERTLAIPGVPTDQQLEETEAAVFRSPEMQREISSQEKQLQRLKSAKAISEQLLSELRTLAAKANTH